MLELCLYKCYNTVVIHVPYRFDHMNDFGGLCYLSVILSLHYQKDICLDQQYLVKRFAVFDKVSS
jgi:hypothetical protein